MSQGKHEDDHFEDCEDDDDDEEEPFSGIITLFLGLVLGLVIGGFEWVSSVMAKPSFVPGQTSKVEQKSSDSEVASTTQPSNSKSPGTNPSLKPKSWWDTTILDIGATCDVIGNRAMPWAKISEMTEPVNLETVSDTIPITNEGEWTIEGALKMVKSLVVPSSVYSLVSLPTRLVQGWKWTAEGKTAQLESPEGDSYVFKLVKGLFRYRGKAKTRGCKVSPWLQKQKGKKQRKSAGEQEKMRRRMLAARENKKAEKANSVASKGKAPNKADGWMKFPGWSQGALGASKIGNILMGVMLLAISSICQSGGVEGAMLEQLAKGWDASVAGGKRKKPVRKMSEAVKAEKLKRGKNRDGRKHKLWGHLPHDCDCDACRRARQTMKQNTRNADPRKIDGADKGYVLGIDLFGPFEDDIDGNEWALIGVEVAHSDYTL